MIVSDEWGRRTSRGERDRMERLRNSDQQCSCTSLLNVSPYPNGRLGALKEPVTRSTWRPAEEKVCDVAGGVAPSFHIPTDAIVDVTISRRVF